MFDPGITESQKAKPALKGGISLDLALTSRCPLRCRYCSVQKTPYPELPAGEWVRIVESFARLRPVEIISLEGGEPFLRADLPAILEACLSVAERVKIVTSGAVPLESLPLSLLQHPRFFLELSMDGPREVHNFLRDGSWDRAWNFLIGGLERHIPIGLRSVISRHNLSLMESWLDDLDKRLESYGPTVTFSYDTILFPETMAGEGGTLERAGINHYPARGLLPSPREMWELFRDLKRKSFVRIGIPQSEPLRGCGFARCGGVSLDPAGCFSFCCEAPRGLGWIQRTSVEYCLFLLEASARNRPCRGCPYFQGDLCHGCWTGQKCGMVNYWGAKSCQALYARMVQGETLSLETHCVPGRAWVKSPETGGRRTSFLGEGTNLRGAE